MRREEEEGCEDGKLGSNMKFEMGSDGLPGKIGRTATARECP